MNDNAPVFYPTHYNISVRQNEPRGTALLRVSATDADADDHGNVVYSVKQPHSHMFRVDAHNG